LNAPRYLRRVYSIVPNKQGKYKNESHVMACYDQRKMIMPENRKSFVIRDEGRKTPVAPYRYMLDPAMNGEGGN
jgi:hypothetical protein